MPTTANFALPYPGALDEPCDFAQDWCAFTDAAQLVLSDFQASADRMYPVQPVAKMEITTNTFVVNNSIIPFDTVTFSNAGWIDFDASRTTITLNRPGRFIACFNAFMQTTFVANSRFQIKFGLAPLSEQDSTELDLATTSVAFVGNALYNTTTPGTNIYIQLASTAAVANLEIQYASLSVYWHSDGAAP